MQQQQTNYDLLAVFPDETQANSAVNKLQQAGYSSDEIFQLQAGSVSGGTFREHGPSSNRNQYFLQTTRSRPSALLILLFALAFAILLGGVGFVLALILVIALLHTFVILEPITAAAGVVIGLVVGAITAIQRGSRVRGNIGQNARQRTTPAPAPVAATSATEAQGAKTVVAIRLPDPDDIKRQSQARAILVQNKGKIDRSVTRNE